MPGNSVTSLIFQRLFLLGLILQAIFPIGLILLMNLFLLGLFNRSISPDRSAPHNRPDSPDNFASHDSSGSLDGPLSGCSRRLYHYSHCMASQQT